MAMVVDDLEDRVRALVAEQIGISPGMIQSGTDVVDDLRIYGDDVWELVERFAEEFSVEMSGFRWYHHSGPEGGHPLWLLFPPWWARKKHVPIRLADLVASARRGSWTVEYPDDEGAA